MTFFAQLVKATNIPQATANKDQLTTVFNVILATMGALAFFMFMLAAFRYTISQGEPEKMSNARRTMTYSIIGLVVIASAATIVNFVASRT